MFMDLVHVILFCDEALSGFFLEVFLGGFFSQNGIYCGHVFLEKYDRKKEIGRSRMKND